MLVDNKFVFVKIPKNASTSVQTSLLIHKINVYSGDDFIDKENKESIKIIETTENYSDVKNYHQHTSYLYNLFPRDKYPYVAIHRDSTERFISGFKHLLSFINNGKIKNLRVDFNSLDENNIIEYFKPVFQKISSKIEMDESYYKIVKEYFCGDDNEIQKTNILPLVKNLQSQYFWEIHKCDYVFNFNNLGEFEKFVNKELNKDFKLVHLNSTNTTNSILKKTDKLDEFVYKYIDSPFLEKKLL